MKLDYKKTFVVGLAFLSICAFWQMYDQVVPLMLRYSFGIDGFANGAIMAVDNILAVFLLPVFGSLSDKTKTRWGRRMPYIVFGSFAACAAMMLVPVANNIASLPLFIVGLGLTLLFMATYRSPAVALMPDVTPKPLRSKGNAIINLTGVVGNMLALGLGTIMLPKLAEGATEYHANYVPLYLAVMGIMVISVLALMLTVNEPKLAKKMQQDSIKYGVEDAKEEVSTEKRPMDKGKRKALILLMASIALWFMGYNAVTTYFSTYGVEIFGMSPGQSGTVLMVAQGAAIVTFIPSGIIATKIGRKKTIMAGVILLAIAFGTATLFTSFTPVIFVQFALAGIAWACINVNSLPMVVDLARNGEIGRFTGFYYAASMTAQILTPMLASTLMDEINTRILLPYGAVFVALSFVTMIFVKHGDSKPAETKKGLEAFEDMDD